MNLTRLGRVGGGVQNAASFLEELAELGLISQFHVVAFRNTPLGDLVKRLGGPHLLLNRTGRERLAFDLQCRQVFKKGQVCFTFFGAPWYRSRGYLLNVSGVAFSNLYYPELPFWQFLPLPARIIKHIRDTGRMLGCSWPDYWIFETDTMARRAHELAGYPQERVGVVRMTPSKLVSPERITPSKRLEFTERIGDGVALLFLAGPNPNKRISFVAPAVSTIQEQQMLNTPVKIVTTLDNSSGYYRTVEQEFRRFELLNNWVNLGPVPPEDVASLIDACTIVCLFSALESFSNNCVEAWMMKKPLLVTNVDWARDSCGDAAVYVDPRNSSQVASAVRRIATDHEYRESLLNNYSRQLRSYPTRRDKCLSYLDHLRKARDLGFLPASERHGMCRFRCKNRLAG